jgi:hypothetical protein
LKEDKKPEVKKLKEDKKPDGDPTNVPGKVRMQKYEGFGPS